MATDELVRKRKTNANSNLKTGDDIVTSTNEGENSGEKKDLKTSSSEDSVSLEVEKSSYHLTRIVLIRFLAFIYG